MYVVVGVIVVVVVVIDGCSLSRVQAGVIRPASDSPLPPTSNPRPSASHPARSRSPSRSIIQSALRLVDVGRWRHAKTGRIIRNEGRPGGSHWRRYERDARRERERKREGMRDGDAEGGSGNGGSQAATKIPCQIETGAQAWRTLPAPLCYRRYLHDTITLIPPSSLHPPRFHDPATASAPVSFSCHPVYFLYFIGFLWPLCRWPTCSFQPPRATFLCSSVLFYALVAFLGCENPSSKLRATFAGKDQGREIAEPPPLVISSLFVYEI